MASSWYGIVHHLSGPMDLASTQNPVHWTLGPVSHAEPAARACTTPQPTGVRVPRPSVTPSALAAGLATRRGSAHPPWREGLPTSRPVWEERCFHRALRFRQDRTSGRASSIDSLVRVSRRAESSTGNAKLRASAPCTMRGEPQGLRWAPAKWCGHHRPGDPKNRDWAPSGWHTRRRARFSAAPL